MQLEPGTKVDRYVVEGLLGAGGMAEVYAVRHAVLGSPAALKLLRIHAPHLVGRMLREGRAQAQLQHPNVVAVLDLIEVDGSPGLVMERVDGPTLAQVLQSGPLRPDRFDRIARGLLAGLRAAHRLGIVHRDLKPANVLLARGDTVRIADFGLATALADEVDNALTRPGTTLGTPAYMSPEQHQDAHKVDARSDLFSLGVVLYEMALGNAPAAGANLVNAWQKMSGKHWVPPREIDPTLPDRVNDAICWALEPTLADRVPSVERLWETLFAEPFPGEPNATLVGVPEPTMVPMTTAGSFRGEAPPARPPGLQGISGLGMPPTPAGPVVPKPARSLVGRAAELSALWDALDARGTLQTLVGTGGSGKTRLAVELASRWVDQGRPAVWVDLQAARHETDLLQAIAWALDDGTEPSLSMLGRSLARRGALLLVLDNLEQLPRSAGALVAGLARSAASLRVLVTSRQPLGTPEEHLTDLAPFVVPDDPAAALASDAWAMFVAAAGRTSLARVDAAQAQRLLRALDGLPLAIELAAARLEILDADELERRLADRFAVLSDPGASGERHGGLWDAIAWSWSLLTDAERAALSQLAVFAAPFPLAAAEGALVLPAGGSVLDALHGLVRRNMIRRTGPRFALLLSIREFADRQLGDAGRAEAWARHCSWHADRAWGILGERLGDPDLLPPLEELAPELEIALARAATAPGLAADAQRAALCLAALHYRRSPMSAVARVCELGLQINVPGDAAQRVRMRIALVYGVGLRGLGDLDAATTVFASLLAEDPPLDLRASTIANLADLALDGGDGAGAEAYYREAFALARVHGPNHTAAITATSLAVIVHERDPQEADELTALGAALVSKDDRFAQLEIAKNTGWIALTRGQYDVADQMYRRVLELAQQARILRMVGTTTGQLGLIADCLGRLDVAEALLRDGVDRLSQVGDPIYTAYYTAFLGRVLLRKGRWTEGTEKLEQALGVAGMDPVVRAPLQDTLALAYARGADERRAQETQSAKSDDVPVLVARAARAVAAGDRTGAMALVTDARSRVMKSDWGPLAAQILDAIASDAGAWRISVDGTRVETPDGRRIDLGRHGANARILGRLGRERTTSPGSAVDAEGLADAGWPGERIVPAAAANRVRVALSALRREGLADLIERVEGGWRLDPAQPVQLLPA